MVPWAMTSETSSQTWLVTGAGRGIGRAIALSALEAGHQVVATVRSAHSLPEHERLDLVELDVRDRAAAHRVVDEARARHGAVHVLVNNAGYGLIGAAEEVTEDEAREILETDLLGALWLSQAVLPSMREQGSGHIIQISTVGAVGSMPFLGLYNAAKWGLEGFSEALAAEVGAFGIRVTIAELGEIDTEWATGSMRFSSPLPAYDELRESVLGSPTVPWPVEPGSTGGGTSAQEVADVLLRHAADPTDTRLRLLVGDDAPGQVATVLSMRQADYASDPRFAGALGAARTETEAG